MLSYRNLDSKMTQGTNTFFAFVSMKIEDDYLKKILRNLKRNNINKKN